MIDRSAPQRLTEEAATWVARLKDAHSVTDRRNFERWLAQDPAHGIAYDDALATYDASALLRASPVGRERNLASAFRMREPIFGRRLAIASIAALVLLGAYQLSREFGLLRPVALETVMLSSGTEARIVTLVDGSTLSMAPATQVRIDLNRHERFAEIRKGKVRLIVAQDQRPFRIVAAARTAEGNIGTFDAQVVGGRGMISKAPGPGAAPITSVPPHAGATAVTASVQQDLEFDGEPLGEAVDRINQVHAGPRVELDPRLADLRVTGVFQRGSSETIARSLARAFDLRLMRTPSAMLLLPAQK